MDLRTRTTLLCGALALAIAASILLRGRNRTVHRIFAMFAADMGLWYLAQSLYSLGRDPLWSRFTAILAILLPQFALHLFEAVVPHPPGRRSRLLRVAGMLALPTAVLVLATQHRNPASRTVVFFYVFGLLAAGLWSLALRGRASPSRATQGRVRFLVVVGALAAIFSCADFLWFLGAELPPVGAVLSIVFVFMLAESLRRERLLDLYELLGRLLVSTALAFSLAGIFYVFVELVGGFDTMYLNAVLAAIVILVLFEPLRLEVERRIHRVFFRERGDLVAAVGEARRKLVYVLELDELRSVFASAMEESRRVTAAALYLTDPTGYAFDRAAGVGESLPERIELASARPLLDRVARGPVALEPVAREAAERRAVGQPDEELEAILSAAEVLGPLREGVVLPIREGRGELAGLLVVADDRVRDAFADDEVALLESFAAQIGIVIENSQVYRRMRERERLVTIGQMATGLAHEVKNPLGAIKGAAQLLADPAPGAPELDASSREFVAIILEEVDRLDRVVGSILDYARPTRGNPGPVDVNAVVRRTVQILSSDRSDEATIETSIEGNLPTVRVDAEQLRQVLLNLVQNAVQAMNGRGVVRVATRVRGGRARDAAGPPGWVEPAWVEPAWVEIAVSDSGPGISQKVLKNLFVPFFTTKNVGTGLGLAISQRIVRGAGGSIEVRTGEGAGTTFTVVLPASLDPLGVAPEPARAADQA